MFCSDRKDNSIDLESLDDAVLGEFFRILNEWEVTSFDSSTIDINNNSRSTLNKETNYDNR